MSGAMLDTMRRLYPRGPANRGICVDSDGATLGPDLVLVGRTQSGFRPVERSDASQIQKCALAPDRDQDWLFRQCQRIADALNRGEVALAQIYGLYIPVGELNARQLRRLSGIRFAKGGFDPDEPRLPKGDPHGGEWTTGDGGNAPGAVLHPKPLDAFDLEPRDLAALPAGNVHPRLLADLAITAPNDASRTDGDTQPRRLPQSTAIESGATSPTGAAITGSEPHAPEQPRLRYEMRSPGATTASPAERPGENGDTPAAGGRAPAGLYVPGRDAIKPDYSIEDFLSNLAGGGGFFFAGKTARVLARALEAAGVARPLGYVTHHIVAIERKLAQAARDVLERFKIKLDEAINGTFLPPTQHNHLHTNKYYKTVNDLLASATTRAEAEQILQAIARALEAGMFPLP